MYTSGVSNLNDDTGSRPFSVSPNSSSASSHLDLVAHPPAVQAVNGVPDRPPITPAARALSRSRGDG